MLSQNGNAIFDEHKPLLDENANQHGDRDKHDVHAERFDCVRGDRERSARRPLINGDHADGIVFAHLARIEAANRQALARRPVD